MKGSLLLSLAGLLWLLLIAGGLRTLLVYESAPGIAAVGPVKWPQGSAIPFERKATLVMLAHPRCPCTRASINELALVMARAPAKVAAHVLLSCPAGAGDEWSETDIGAGAAAIPGVVVHRDEDGAEASRFGAATSGQVLIYDGVGSLIFSGGITASRGQSGDNAGRDAIVALLNRGSAKADTTPVFGCSLVASREGSK